MVSFLSILTIFLVFVGIFSPSYSIKCHICQNTPECPNAGAGEVKDCKYDTPDAVGCVTVTPKGTTNGNYGRFCLSAGGREECKAPEYTQKCKMCFEDSCNIHTNI